MPTVQDHLLRLRGIALEIASNSQTYQHVALRDSSKRLMVALRKLEEHLGSTKRLPTSQLQAIPQQVRRSVA